MSEGKYGIDSLDAFVARLEDLSDEVARQDGTGLSLDRYFKALAAYLVDRNAARRRAGEDLPEEPTWQLIADGLHAAIYYRTDGEH